MCGIVKDIDQDNLLEDMCREISGLIGHDVIYQWHWHKQVVSLTGKDEASDHILSSEMVGVTVWITLKPKMGQVFKYGLNYVSSFALTQMPGDGFIYVSSNQHVAPAYQNHGIGTLMTKTKESLVRSWGGLAMIATVSYSNVPENKILDGLDWSPDGIPVAGVRLRYKDLED